MALIFKSNKVQTLYIGRDKVTTLYLGKIKIYQANQSCYSKGHWIGTKPWVGTEAWKG